MTKNRNKREKNPVKRAGGNTVAIIMGSRNDRGTKDDPQMDAAARLLIDVGVSIGGGVKSAHRTPEAMRSFARTAKKDGIGYIIAGAGGSAHLAGMTAAFAEELPVFAVGIISKTPGSTEAAEFSNTRMPPGCPVAFMGVGKAGAINAALMVAKLIAKTDARVAKALEHYYRKQRAEVAEHDSEVMLAYSDMRFK